MSVSAAHLVLMCVTHFLTFLSLRGISTVSSGYPAAKTTAKTPDLNMVI